MTDLAQVFFLHQMRVVAIEVGLRLILREKDQEIASLKTLLAYYGGI